MITVLKGDMNICKRMTHMDVKIRDCWHNIHLTILLLLFVKRH